MGLTTLDRQVGPAAAVVTLAGTVLAGTQVGPVSIRHGRQSPTTRPEPATLSVTVDPAALPTLPTVGDPVTVDYGDDALALLGLDPGDPAARRFTGEVTDLDLVPSGKTGPRRSSLRVTAVSRRQRLARVAVGDVPWPAEADGARAARILALAGAAGVQDWTGTDPAGWFDNWLGVPGADDIASAPTEGAVKVTWHPGSVTAAGFVWRYATDQITGRAYTVTAEVYVPTGQPPLEINNLFVAAGGRVDPAERWQSVTLTYTAPDTADRAIGLGIPGDAHDPDRPAGTYFYVRAFRVYESDEPVLGDVDPGMVEVLARDVDRQPALGLLDALALDSGSELVELRDGRFEWHQANRRDNVSPAVELTGLEVLARPRFTMSLGDIVNDATVVYGPPVEGADRASERVVDVASIALHGRVAIRRDTQLAEAVDAETVALLLVGRNSRAHWTLRALEVDLTRTVDPTVAAILAGLEFGALLAVTGFPSEAPVTSARVWVEGWTETIAPAGWRLALAVSEYGMTGPPVTWAEVPADLTWADLAADGMSWLGATSWRPADTSSGRWLDYPTDLRWSDLDPGTTWTDLT